MIIVSVISLLFSLFLQGLVSNFQSYTMHDLSIFSAVYMLLTLVVLQPYFENDKKFLILIIIFGVLLDITYSNTFILCTCIFLAIFYLNKLLNFFFPYNLFTVNLFAAYGKTLAIMYNTIIAVIINVVLNIVLSHHIIKKVTEKLVDVLTILNVLTLGFTRSIILFIIRNHRKLKQVKYVKEVD